MITPKFFNILCILFCGCFVSQITNGQIVGDGGIVYSKDSIVIPYDYGIKPFLFIAVPTGFISGKTIRLTKFRYSQKTDLLTEWQLRKNPKSYKDSTFRNGYYIWNYTKEQQKKMRKALNWDSQDLRDSLSIKVIPYSRWKLVGYNMIFPGWGTYQASGNKKWLYMGGTGYLLLATTFATRLAYVNTYKKYKASPILSSTYSEPDMYQRSVNLNNLFYAQFIAASIVWAEQLIHVMVYHPKYQYKKQAKKVAFFPTYNPANATSSLTFHLTF